VNNFVCFTFYTFPIIEIKNSKFSFVTNSDFFDLRSKKNNFEYCFILKISKIHFYQLLRKYFPQWSNYENKHSEFLLTNWLNFEICFLNERPVQILPQKLFLINPLCFVNVRITNFDDISKIIINSNFVKLGSGAIESRILEKYNLFLFLDLKLEDLIKIKLVKNWTQLISNFLISFMIYSSNKNFELDYPIISNFIISENNSIQFNDFISDENITFLVLWLNIEQVRNTFLKNKFKKNNFTNHEWLHSFNFSLISLIIFNHIYYRIIKKFICENKKFSNFNLIDLILCNLHFYVLYKLFEITNAFSKTSTSKFFLIQCSNENVFFNYLKRCHNYISFLINSINGALNIYTIFRNSTNHCVSQYHFKKNLFVRQSDMDHNCLSLSANTTCNQPTHDNLYDNSSNPAVLHQHANTDLSARQSDMDHNCLSLSAQTI